MSTIRAKTNSHFAVLKKEDYVKIIKILEQNKLTKKVEFLKTFPIFQKWHKDYLYTFSFSFKEKIFGRNHKVIKEGLPSEKLYIEVEGEFLPRETRLQWSKEHLEESHRLRTHKCSQNT
jgi:hypothetical protein